MGRSWSEYYMQIWKPFPDIWEMETPITPQVFQNIESLQEEANSERDENNYSSLQVMTTNIKITSCPKPSGQEQFLHQ